MVRVGIIGTGDNVAVAHHHVQGLLNDGRAEIAAVLNSRRESAEKWVSQRGLNARVCSSVEELMDCVDAVSICTPNKFHCSYAREAIKAGKHFLVEKPLAVGIEEARALAAACKDYSACNMVGFVYRFSAAAQAARKIVQEQLGEIYTCTAWFGGKRLSDPQLPLEWRMVRESSGSGALGDFGSHLIDLADFVAGQRYDEVSALTDSFIPRRMHKGLMTGIENDDAAAFVAKGSRGIGSYTVSRVGMDDVMLLITGQGGMLQLSLRNPSGITYWEKLPDGGYTGKINSFAFPEEESPARWFDGEMSAFLDWIEGREHMAADAAQGLYVEEVLHAAELSSISGKAERVQL